MSLLLDHIHQEKSKQDSLHETVARQRENAMNLEELQTNLHREREQRRYDVRVARAARWCVADARAWRARSRTCTRRRSPR